MCASCHTATMEEQPVVITPTPAATAGPEDAVTPTPTGPAAIPHEIAGREQCLMCHDPAGNIRPAPSDHAGRTADTCQMCHQPSATGMGEPEPTAPAAAQRQEAPQIPHAVAGRDDCLACHNPVGGLKPAPADHAGRTNDVCQTCHNEEQ
jgi:predicted CXXCH cytochrome family protein